MKEAAPPAAAACEGDRERERERKRGSRGRGADGRGTSFRDSARRSLSLARPSALPSFLPQLLLRPKTTWSWPPNPSSAPMMELGPPLPPSSSVLCPSPPSDRRPGRLPFKSRLLAWQRAFLPPRMKAVGRSVEEARLMYDRSKEREGTGRASERASKGPSE